MNYLAYMNILFGDNHVQDSGNWREKKRGNALRDHSGIKNRIKKIPVD
jgi:prepilin-type processing-associated H-X9-DG protein